MHRLFFAIFPHPSALEAIGRIAAELRAANVVRGRWTTPAKYHITARFLGDHADPADELIARAKAAAAQLRSAPFQITFDRVVTFRGRYQSPCVLRCTPLSDSAMQQLWRGLGAVLPGVRSEEMEHRFLPHLTIAYGDRMLEAPISIEPIVSRIEEFALIDSNGAQHAALARWPLTA